MRINLACWQRTVSHLLVYQMPSFGAELLTGEACAVAVLPCCVAGMLCGGCSSRRILKAC
jgi:hypothetical protein